VPTYVYACRSCEGQVEVVQKMSDPPLTECEKCGGSLRKVLFPPAVVYKGSGFYTTDYKNGGRKANGASSESSGSDAKSDTAKSETKSDSTPETKSESKPEAKSEAKPESKTAA
jgi:putative FmdB family regulatory protein